MTEKKDPRVKIENLPKPEQELTPDEQEQVQGGGFALSGQPDSISGEQQPGADESPTATMHHIITD